VPGVNLARSADAGYALARHDPELGQVAAQWLLRYARR
jgi:hypothetical protein